MVFVVVELHDPVGREREDAEPVAREVVGAFRAVERAVPAIVLQHVKAHAREGVDDDKRHHEPPDGPRLHRQPEGEEVGREGAEIADRRDAVIAGGPVAREGPDFPVGLTTVARSDLRSHRQVSSHGSGLAAKQSHTCTGPPLAVTHGPPHSG
jgi:hypothetical protein